MPRKAALSPGAALKAAVLGEYDLEPHELLLLEQAAHTADICAHLQVMVDVDGGLTEEGSVTPALVELRMQRLTLGRLLAALRIPVENKHLPARSARGFYAKPRVWCRETQTAASAAGDAGPVARFPPCRLGTARRPCR
jgi:hypothetical protein